MQLRRVSTKSLTLTMGGSATTATVISSETCVAHKFSICIRYVKLCIVLVRQSCSATVEGLLDASCLDVVRACGPAVAFLTEASIL